MVHSVNMDRREAVLVAIAEFQRVEVVPAAAALAVRPGVLNPANDIGKAHDDLGPLGEIVLGCVGGFVAGVTLDVVLDAPAVGGRAPQRSLVDGEVVR